MSDPIIRQNRGRAGLGRPKGSANKATRELRESAREYTELAIETLVAVMKNGRAMASARIKAAEIMLAYGHGKPRQTIGLEGRLTLEQLIAQSFAPGGQGDSGDRSVNG